VQKQKRRRIRKINSTIYTKFYFYPTVLATKASKKKQHFAILNTKKFTIFRFDGCCLQWSDLVCVFSGVI
jgi:hypothetical protein